MYKSISCDYIKYILSDKGQWDNPTLLVLNASLLLGFYSVELFFLPSSGEFNKTLTTINTFFFRNHQLLIGILCFNV